MVASSRAGGAISLKGCRRGLRWPAGGLNTARRRWLGRVLLRWPAGGLNTARRRWLGRTWLWWPAGGLNTTRWRWLGCVCAGVIACCAFASSAPSIACGARPPLGSASGLGGLALDRVFHSVEGCRATPRGCGLLLVHGRVYGQEVLGFRRLWARALVPGLNHFGLVLETVCAFYGVAR